MRCTSYLCARVIIQRMPIRHGESRLCKATLTSSSLARLPGSSQSRARTHTDLLLRNLNDLLRRWVMGGFGRELKGA
eukprot:14098568-Heterocapsa_arctica.AAC.1